MGIKRAIIVGIVLLFSAALSAQEKIEHTIVKGNTLFGLAKEYGSSVEAIYDANPGLGIRNLVIGETILIPVPKREVIDSNAYLFHTVRSFESVYSISTKYAIKDSTIYWHNPVLNNSPLVKQGQVLRIPKDAASWLPYRREFNTLRPNEVPKYEVYLVKKGDTPDELRKEWGYNNLDEFFQVNPDARNDWYAGMPLVKPLTQDVARSQSSVRVSSDTNKINVADTVHQLKVVGLLPFFTQDYINGSNRADRSKIALRFRAGMELAASQWADSSLTVDLSFYDTYNQADSLAKLLEKVDWSGVDFVVGPMYASRVVEAQKVIPSKKLISPMSKSAEIGKTGVWNSVVEEDVYWRAMVAQFREEFAFMGANDQGPSAVKFLLVGQENDHSYKIMRLFENALGKGRLKVVLNGEGWTQNESLASLDTAGTYRLVIMENDPAFALDVLRNLRKGHAYYHWYAIEPQVVDRGLVSSTFEREEAVFVFYSGYTDYSQQRTLAFVDEFRKKYGFEPDRYAIAGYDNMWFHLQRASRGTKSWRGIHQGFNFEGVQGQNRYIELRKFEGYQWILQGNATAKYEAGEQQGL